jgi:hypothetical protein
MKESDLLLMLIQPAERWECSVKDPDADWLRGTGCRHVKIGRLARHRVPDVEMIEGIHLHPSIPINLPVYPQAHRPVVQAVHGWLISGT